MIESINKRVTYLIKEILIKHILHSQIHIENLEIINYYTPKYTN